jgi:PAS domain S-box-containing protein
MKSNIRIIGTLVAMVLLVALGICISIGSFSRMTAAVEERSRLKEALRRSDALLSDLKDAETGQRGYLLTGDEAFLAPYSSVRLYVRNDLEELRALSTTAPARAHIEAAAPLVLAKMDELAATIELARSHQAETAIAMVRTGQGKKLLDQIRSEMSAFNQIEGNAMEQEVRALRSQMSLLSTSIAVGSALAMFLALLLAFLVYRDRQHRHNNLLHIETQRLLEVQTRTSGELQQANLLLQASEEKLEVIVGSIGDGLIATDAEARVTFLNPVAAELTGWSQADAAGRPVTEVFNIINHGTRLPGIVPVAATLVHGTIHGLANDTVLIARGGRETIIADSCAPMHDRDRRVVGAVLVFRDVSGEFEEKEKRRLSESALQEANEDLERATSTAERANLAKSDFLSSMSHELRSPLNAILGFAQLMESATPPPTPAQAGRIEQILKAGWHLLNLINEILDLAVVESGRLSLSLEPVSLSEVLSECQTMMETQAQKTGVAMDFPPPGGPRYVRADRTRLKQIIINLVSNAIKYNKASGSVFVECRETTPETIRLSVRDTGEGLEPEKIAQLFQPFNRLGQEAGGVSGTGIGLVVTKKLVELIGGRIGVESTVGSGSTFWIDLLVAPPPALHPGSSAGNAAAEAQRSTGGRQRSVLYVEDNPANMLLVEELIARFPDLRMLTAVNGNLGIEKARACLPDLILMDINLPGLSGIEAMKILRKDPLTAGVPIVALSANAMPRDIQKGMDAGFFRYITKPIKVAEFMETVRQALEGPEGGPRPGPGAPSAT